MNIDPLVWENITHFMGIMKQTAEKCHSVYGEL